MKTLLYIALCVFAFTVMSSCVVSKKKYEALEAELTQLKADLKDEDRDCVPNYLDLELQTDTLAKVDSHGRTIRVEKVVDIDQDGILDVNDFCPTIKGVAAANGCPDWDGDGVYDFLDVCPRAPGIKEERGCPRITTATKDVLDGPYAFHKVNFISKTEKFDSLTSETIDGFMNHLFKIYKERENSIDTIKLFSHTDNILDSLKSMKLSLKRAKKVQNLMIKKGFPKQKLLIIAKGNSEPMWPNNGKGIKWNNRIDFIFIFNDL